MTTSYFIQTKYCPVVSTKKKNVSDLEIIVYHRFL